MPFVFDPKINGEIWIPEPTPNRDKKYPCPDCDSCAHCGEARCRLCRRKPNCRQKRKSQHRTPS